MALYGDGRSGTYSATVTQYGGYKTPATPTVVVDPSPSRLLSQPIVPTISDAVSAIPNLSARWRADQITGIANGGAVTTWPEASGYGRDATQATSIFQPTWQASGIGGQPSVRFTASAQTHFNSTAPSGAPEQTVVAVIKLASTGGTQTIRAGGAEVDPNGAGALQLRIDPSGVPALLEQNLAGIGVGTTAISTAAVAVAATFSDSANTYAFQVDGGAAGSGSAANTLQSRTTRIGLHASGAEGFDGDIAELIVWDRVLTGPELATVQTYITARYTAPEVHTTTGTATGAASASASTTTTRTKTGAGSATATATGSTSSSRTKTATATATATATRTGSSTRTQTGTATATATATRVGATVRTKTGAATATATTSGTTVTTRTKTGTLTAAATASGATASQRVKTGTATATATATGTTSSTFAEIHTTTGTAAATATASSVGTSTRITARTALATASASAVTGQASGPVIYAGPLETLTVGADRRVATVGAELRTLEVGGESRRFPVTPDQRTDTVPAATRNLATVGS